MSIGKYQRARDKMTFRDEDSEDEIIIDDKDEEDENKGLMNEL